MFRTALRFIRYDRPKSIGIIVGIVISIFLIGQQLGTLQFIMRVMAGLVYNAHPEVGEIWVVDNSTESTEVLAQIDSRFVQEIRSIKGVQFTYPVVIANAKITLANGKSSMVSLVGSEAPFFAGGPDSSKILQGQLSDLAGPEAVSLEYFDANKIDPDLKVGSHLEISGKNAVIKVKTKHVQAFGGHYMYTNIHNARAYGRFPIDKVSIIIVKLAPGAEVQETVKQINQSFLGSGIRAWDVHQLRRSTILSMLSRTNMGMTFGTLIGFAMITGFFIIGLTLYSAVLDRINDYGTLKAIGAQNRYVRRLILTQAIIFSVIGFSIAMILLMGLKEGMANSGLILRFTPQLVLILFGITLFISVGGSLFAIGKINKLEPASIFR